MRDKIRINKDEDAYRAWAMGHDHCMACGIFHKDAECRDPAGLSNHHIIKFRRSHDPENLLRLCLVCHELAELLTVRLPDRTEAPKLTLAVALRLKQVRDLLFWNLARLRELYGRTLPDVVPVPEYFERQYRENRPWDWRTFDLEAVPLEGVGGE